MALDGRGVGALAGPRVLGRLTPELILRSPQYMNCVGQYELDMRANRINVIENLGATENQFDSIDLSDNGIVRLEGFPKLLRLKVLHLNSNRVIKIGRGLEASVPALEWLLLTNNKLTNLTDIEPLRTLPRLKYLSLLENPITKQKGYRCEDVRVSACPSKAVCCAKVVTRKYGLCLVGLPSTPLPLDSLAFRLYVISRLPHLKVLDFRKVKQTERQEAVRQYPMGLAPAPAATFEPDEDLAEVKAALPAAAAAASSAEPSTRSGPTPEQATAIRAAIAAATTLKEVQRLEEALTTGQLPSQISVPSPMEEGE
ncbi:hypothetical protein ACKKBF_B08920 [Auxenochlorella protothecoides x Auxenochlorella symbiontica]